MTKTDSTLIKPLLKLTSFSRPARFEAQKDDASFYLIHLKLTCLWWLRLKNATQFNVIVITDTTNQTQHVAQFYASSIYSGHEKLSLPSVTAQTNGLVAFFAAFTAAHVLAQCQTFE